MYLFNTNTSNNYTLEEGVRKLKKPVRLKSVVSCFKASFNCRTFFQLQENVTAFNIRE